jgi:hypothetical protein
MDQPNQDMKQWTYAGKNPQGFQLKGNLFAATKEEVITIVKNMGVENPTVVPYGEEINLPTPVVGPVSTKASITAALSVPEMSLEHKAQQKNMDSNIRGMAESVQSQVDAMELEEQEHNKPRRQKLVIGEEIRVLAEVEPLLKNLRGQILSVNMVLGNRGLVTYAVVVEHDIEVKK